MSNLSTGISDLASRIGNQFRDLNSIALGDMPSSLVANKMLQVNSGSTAYELVDAPSGGGCLWTESGSDIYYDSGNVGINIAPESGIMLSVRPEAASDIGMHINSTASGQPYLKFSRQGIAKGYVGATYWTNQLFSNVAAGDMCLRSEQKLLIGIGGGNAEIIIDSSGNKFFLEQSSAGSDITGYGQLWVKNDSANTLWFTDDAGADWKIGGAYFPTIGTAIDWKATDVGSKTMTANTTFTDSNLIKGNIIIFRLTGDYAPSFPSYWKDMTGSLDYDGTVVCKIVAECIESASGNEEVEYYITTQIV